MFRSLIVLLCLAVPCAAETWVADFEEFETPQQLEGVEYGPFTFASGRTYTAEHTPNFGNEGSWASGPVGGGLTIQTNAPARLTGGLFRAGAYNPNVPRYATIAVDFSFSKDWEDIEIINFDLSDFEWHELELDIPFTNNLRFSNCSDLILELHEWRCFGTAQDGPVWLDNLTFEVIGAEPQSVGGDGSVSMPGREYEGGGNAVIPEPSTIVLGLVAVAMLVATKRPIWKTGTIR